MTSLKAVPDGAGQAAQTEEAIAAVLGRERQVSGSDAAMTARIVSAIMFLSMAATVNASSHTEAMV